MTKLTSKPVRDTGWADGAIAWPSARLRSVAAP